MPVCAVTVVCVKSWIPTAQTNIQIRAGKHILSALSTAHTAAVSYFKQNRARHRISTFRRAGGPTFANSCELKHRTLLETCPLITSARGLPLGTNDERQQCQRVTAVCSNLPKEIRHNGPKRLNKHNNSSSREKKRRFHEPGFF